MGSAIFIILLIIMAIFAPLVTHLLGLPGPYAQDPNATDAFGSPLGPSAATRSGSTSWGATSPRV